jgi:hypothetical protein
MPVVIACSACQGKMKVADELAGKAVKCPKCGQVIRTAPAPAVTAARPQPAPAGPLVLACPACQKKMQVRPELAGKAVKCPGCGKAVKVPGPATPPPAPAPAGGEGWLDVNEAAAPPPAAAGDWGQGLMDGHRVPDAMSEEFRAALGKGERLVWFDRPKMEILMYQAKRTQLLGILVGSVVFVGGIGAGIYFLTKGQVGISLFGFFFAVIFAAAGTYMAFFPSILRKNADRRACFALTNRRLLIHPGKGTQLRFGRQGGAGAFFDGGGRGIIPYVGLELTKLSRVEMRGFPGDGELLFCRSLFELPWGAGLFAVGNVRAVEKTIRERLLNPVMDRLLRGETLQLADKGQGNKPSGDGEEKGEVVPADANIKDYVTGRSPAVDPEDPNAKGARGPADDAGNVKGVKLGVEYDPKKVPAELRKQVEAELTEGEKVLWVGEPEGSVEGRGLFGKPIGGAHRVEPRYTAYALTNRRVLIWYKSSCRCAAPSNHENGRRNRYAGR